MIASLTLKNSNIDARERDLDGLIKNGSDEYELFFGVKTEFLELELLKFDCYVKDQRLYIYMDFGFDGSVGEFCERVKKFMDGLVTGTTAELNFLEDYSHFCGFVTNNNLITTKISIKGIDYTFPKMIYKTNLQDSFLDNIRTIIEQLHKLSG